MMIAVIVALGDIHFDIHAAPRKLFFYVKMALYDVCFDT